jgi:LmbE family N-acetylglucosaminyl deacetylase
MIPKKILFLLAHQDDEVFIAPRISYELCRGASLFFLYLTNGVAFGEDPSVRDNESRACLKRLGVREEQIVFLGTELHIPDNQLVSHLERCFGSLIERIKGYTIDEVYAPAWEGGHQDHDAAFLIGLALARRLGLESNLWQFYCYNGFNTRGRFFRVFHPLPTTCERRQRKLKVSEGLSILRSIFTFRSQRRTWLGLFPQTLIHLVFCRTEVFDRGTVDQVARPAHEGGLLYERWKRMCFADFENKVQRFKQDFIARDFRDSIR